MLDPWIIEQIRRREQDRLNREQQPVLEIVPSGDGVPEDEVGRGEDPPQGGGPGRGEDDGRRGVVIIDFHV